MSSYHIINAIWVGIFPMLAVMIIIGILFYFLCCLNQIKNRIVHHRKQKALKKARLKIQREKNNQNSLSIDDLENNDFDYAKPDRSKLRLPLEASPGNRRLSWKIGKKSGSAGDLYTTHLDTPMEELVVQELNESPKSIYSRMQSFTNLKKASNESKPEDSNRKNSDSKPRESDINSLNSYSDQDTMNDYDSSSSSDFNRNYSNRNNLFKDKIKKRNEKKKSKSAHHIRLLNDRYRPKLIEIKKANRLSSDIDYGDEIFNDDDSLSSTGFTAPHSKSALTVYKMDRNFSTIKESETASTLSAKGDRRYNTIESSVTLTSLNKSKVLDSMTKSSSLQRSANIHSSSISDIDPDDSILQDMLVKTPKMAIKKIVNFNDCI